MHSINGFQIIEEQPTGSVRLDAGPIKVELLVTIVSPDANHVSFIGNNIDQFELLKETANSGIAT
jgi:hypothetical protein